MKQRTAITPTREENYPEWYQNVITAASLAEHSPVRGCMVIKPWGFAIWENIQKILDDKFKDLGHRNAYFPLLIPLKLIDKEANHIEGFAKECAVVTHSKLVKDQEGKLTASSELEEPFIIRPTSETIIGECLSRWVNSYRDLPLLINQWANVMRWEMRTRLFLRTSEFLWQEGHTVHSTKQEAQKHALTMLDVYEWFVRDFLAIPVIKGEKTYDEKFPGADSTYTIEALMQDNKALQAGTSHFLGQNFSKASNIMFLDKDGQKKHAWTTSWGVSTRLIGGLIMTHSDDNGLVLPPLIAPEQIVILPIYRNDRDEELVLNYCNNLLNKLKNENIRVFIDNRDLNAGEKSWDAIKKGIPIRVEIGPRDLANNKVFMGRRDLEPRDKQSLAVDDFVNNANNILDSIQENIYQKALQRQTEHTFFVKDKASFYKYFEKDNNPGFIKAHVHMNDIIVDELKKIHVTARCIPLNEQLEGECIFTDKLQAPLIIFAKSY